ncbi:MAG: spondin domain-containing protein [Cyanobacteria bacterium P01_C01_bin.69]
MTNTQQVLVSIENTAPENGSALTPLWVGFHNGGFDTIDLGRPASEGVERIAEDGNAAVLNQEFVQSGLGSTQAVIPGPNGPITPGETAELLIDVGEAGTQGRYFNYAAMVLPSNDIFVANDEQREHLVFDRRGRFLGADFIITGDEVLDAGTEVNDEIPENTAFFGQSTDDTGVDENGVVSLSDGFNPGGNILSTPRFSNADFTQPGYELARVRVFNAVVGDDGEETLLGTSKDDYIAGNGGDDTLKGRGGNDRILGGEGNDLLAGQNGDDELLGGAGDDIIRGGNGDDIISGGAGNNRLNGGNGNDLFVLSTEGFADIRGFELGGDRISLGTSGLQFSDLSISQSGRNTVIEAGGQQIASLNRVDVAAVDESLFV